MNGYQRLVSPWRTLVIGAIMFACINYAASLQAHGDTYDPDRYAGHSEVVDV